MRLETGAALLPSIRFPRTTWLRPRAQISVWRAKSKKERALFAAQRCALTGQSGLLRERVRAWTRNRGIAWPDCEQRESAAAAQGDLETNRDILKKGYVSARGSRSSKRLSRITRHALSRTVPSSRALSSGCRINLKVNALEGQYRQAASDQLREGAARLSELEQEYRKSVDASDRQLIVAPTGGEIIGLKYTTAGAVIAPRETIAEVVPFDARLVVEARVRTEDINRVHQGHRRTSVSRLQRPDHEAGLGKVVYVARDRLVDPVTNLPYYMASDRFGSAASLKEAVTSSFRPASAEGLPQGENARHCNTCSSR